MNEKEHYSGDQEGEQTAEDFCQEVNNYWQIEVFPQVEVVYGEIQNILGPVLDKVKAGQKFSNEEILDVKSKTKFLIDQIERVFVLPPAGRLDSVGNLMVGMRNHGFRNTRLILVNQLKILSMGMERFNKTGEWSNPYFPDFPKILKEVGYSQDESEGKQENIGNIDSLIKGALFYNETHAAKAGIKVNYDFKISEDQSDYTIIAKAFLSESLKELILNAIYHTGHGGRIDVSLGIKDDEILITISDTGCGISPENLPKIFDKGFTSRETGTGQGLYFVKTAIEKFCKGKLEAKSEVGKGTKFFVKLPTYKSPDTNVLETK